MFFVHKDFAVAHIRKNCSTSVQYAILMDMGYTEEELDAKKRPDGEGFHIFAEKTIRQEENPSVNRKIMIVRNPINRLYSGYVNQRKRLCVPNDISFHDFVKYILQNDIEDPHFILQTSYDAYRFANEFIRMENELRKLPLKLPHKNKGQKIPEINDKTKLLVYEKYRQDFELLGYTI